MGVRRALQLPGSGEGRRGGQGERPEVVGCLAWAGGVVQLCFGAAAGVSERDFAACVAVSGFPPMGATGAWSPASIVRLAVRLQGSGTRAGGGGVCARGACFHLLRPARLSHRASHLSGFPGRPHSPVFVGLLRPWSSSATSPTPTLSDSAWTLSLGASGLLFVLKPVLSPIHLTHLEELGSFQL